MSSKKGHTEPFVRCYDVGSPTLHQDGYTIYKVTQQVPLPSNVGHAHFISSARRCMSCSLHCKISNTRLQPQRSGRVRVRVRIRVGWKFTMCDFKIAQMEKHTEHYYCSHLCHRHHIYLFTAQYASWSNQQFIGVKWLKSLIAYYLKAIEIKYGYSKYTMISIVHLVQSVQNHSRNDNYSTRSAI